MGRMTWQGLVLRRSRLCLGCFAGAALAVAACDPGYYYRPVGWHRSAGEWIWSDNNLEIRMLSAGGLIGANGLTPEVEVRDLGEWPIVFESSTLTTKRRQYSASIATKNLKYRTVKPGATLRMPLFFHFEGSLYEVMGEAFELDLRYRIGYEPSRNLHIHFVRDR